MSELGKGEYVIKTDPKHDDEVGKKLVGRSVLFKKEGKISFGIEVDIPMNYSMSWGIGSALSTFRRLPKRITNLKYVDFAPQESLAYKDRTVDGSIFEEGKSSRLERIVSKETSENVMELFKELKSWLPLKTAIRFWKLIKKGRGKEIVVVRGHGKKFPLQPGESGKIIDEQLIGEGAEMQRQGNKVGLDEILERYGDPNKTAGIILHACYLDRTKALNPEDTRVPVIYFKGKVSGNMNVFTRAVLVAPKNYGEDKVVN